MRVSEDDGAANLRKPLRTNEIKKIKIGDKIYCIMWVGGVIIWIVEAEARQPRGSKGHEDRNQNKRIQRAALWQAVYLQDRERNPHVGELDRKCW